MNKKLSKTEKLKDLKEKLDHYQKKLDHEMKSYRGVIHESAASEIKHSMVMVYQSMVMEL
ncbi:hypothetical protein JXA63_05200 [Candidatus Woesebacteria bacterium]|nr:hypothetical protein [Candidatus Woesebacteria bacterium]